MAKKVTKILITCLLVWIYFSADKSAWDDQLAIQDHANFFNSAQKTDLKQILKEMLEQYDGLYLIITDYTDNKESRMQEIRNLINTHPIFSYSSPDMFLLLENRQSHTCHLLHLRTRPEISLPGRIGRKSRKVITIYNQVSFQEKDEASNVTYSKLLAELKGYQERRESAKVVSQDVVQALPALMIMLSLIGVFIGGVLLVCKKFKVNIL